MILQYQPIATLLIVITCVILQALACYAYYKFKGRNKLFCLLTETMLH
jgi:ABC-type glycerol-3-phosphate transport system permease component